MPERFRNPQAGVRLNRVLPVYALRRIAYSVAEILLQPNERLLLGKTPLTLQITVRRRGEKMYKRKNIPRTTHPEFLSVEEQLVSSKLLPTTSLYKSHSQPLVFESRPRVQPVANTTWTRSIRDRNRRMDEYPSLKKYRRKQPSTFGVVGHQEGSEVDILERQHKHRPRARFVRTKAAAH